MDTAIAVPNAHSIQSLLQSSISHLRKQKCPTLLGPPNAKLTVIGVGGWDLCGALAVLTFIGERRAQNNKAQKKKIWYVVLSFPWNAVQPFILSPLSSSHSIFRIAKFNYSKLNASTEFPSEGHRTFHRASPSNQRTWLDIWGCSSRTSPASPRSLELRDMPPVLLSRLPVWLAESERVP